MATLREQFKDVQELLDQVHSLVDSNTPSDLNRAATILKSLLPKYKDLSVNEESKRPENLEVLKEIKSRLTEETQRVMNKKEEAKNLQQQQQQLQHQQLQQQQQQQILESNTRSKPQELPKPPLLSGYLKKQGDKGLVKSFKKRWFQQRDTKLYYYDKEGDSEPYGFVNLPDMINVKTVDSGFELATPSRIYIFQVFKPSDLNYWTEGLKDFKKYYQSLQNSQKFGSGSSQSSNMASSNSFSDFRKFSDVPPSASQRTPIKDRRGTISGGSTNNLNDDADFNNNNNNNNSNLSSSYVPPPTSSSFNQNDEELKRREAEIIRKGQEKLKREQEEQELLHQQQLQQQQQQELEQQLKQQQQQQLQQQQQQDYQSPSQPQQPSPSQSPYSSRHGSMNYSQQQQQQQQSPQQPSTQQTNPQVIISNNNSPRFESQQQQQQHHQHENKTNLESFRKSIEDELTKKFVKEKQELMEFEIKKRLEMENELKNVNTLLEQAKFENELKQKQATIDLKKKKDEIEELTVQVNVLTKRNETMDSKIKQLESITPIETFPHEFLWTEEVTSRDQKIAAQNKRILELEEQLKLKDNAVSVIKRENEMLRQETEKKDKYINELLSKGGNSGSSNYQASQSSSKSSSSSSGNHHHGDDKIKESMVAHQTQNSFLLQEIQRLETQSQFKLDIKLQQIDELERQLEQQLYQFHRFREAIIGTLSNEYCDKLEKENLDIKKEFFQCLGVSIKLHRVREGFYENVDINSLFDKVIKENVHYRNWPEWISNQLRSTTTNN